MTTLILLLPLGLLVVAAIYDLRTREIPDWISIALVVEAVCAAAFGVANVQWWMVFSGGLTGFALGAAAFRFCGFGGGDAKLIAALGTILGPVALLIVLFWMAIVGGMFALVATIRGQRDYAYVPAITVGFAGYLIYPGGLLRFVFT